MANKKGHKANHIPINFVDHEQDSATSEQEGNEQALESRSDEDDLSAEEIGRASGYEDETEVQRRVDRGQEEDSERGHDRADDADSAGSAPSDELPERREDQHQSAPNQQTTAAHSDTEAGAPRATLDSTAMGPAAAELIATRAELRRVEGERNDLPDALARREGGFGNLRQAVERGGTGSYNRIVRGGRGQVVP